MSKDQKIIKVKVGLLELAKQLGNVSQACKVMGYSRDSFYRFNADSGHEQALDELALSHREAREVTDDELGGRNVRRLGTECRFEGTIGVRPLGIDGVRRLLHSRELFVRHTGELADARKVRGSRRAGPPGRGDARRARQEGSLRSRPPPGGQPEELRRKRVGHRTLTRTVIFRTEGGGEVTMTRSSPREERFDVRTTREQKKLLKRAADLQGRSLTDFVLTSAQEVARRTIAEHTILELSERDRKVFVASLLSPPAPNARLVRAAERHKRLTTE